MSTIVARESHRLRGLLWGLGGLTAAATLTSSGVAPHASHPGKTRVLGQQFSASSSAGSTSTTPGNNGCGNGNSGASGGKDCSNPGHPITVTGTVLGVVYPGTSSKLRLQIVNSNNQDLTLQSATAAIGTPSKPGCAASWFSVASYAGTPSITLKKNSTTALDLNFAMLNKPLNQDACKTASIPLNFSATAAG